MALADRTHALGPVPPMRCFSRPSLGGHHGLAYRTWSWVWTTSSVVAYALVTNTLLMTLYSMNNMPYSALGGVMTGDVNERASLNSFRFVAVNVAQFIVQGVHASLGGEVFGPEHDRQRGGPDDGTRSSSALSSS